MSRRKKRRMGRAPEVAVPVVDPVEFDIVDDVPGSANAVDTANAGAKPARPPVLGAAKPDAAQPRRPTVGESKRTPPPPKPQAAAPSRKPEPPAKPAVAAALPVAGDASRVHAIAPRETSERGAADDTGESRHDVYTVGELLQQAREARGLSLEETSARTRIALKMLRHLENDHFDEFPADAYVKGFLRSYGGFLGLEVGMLIRRYEAFAGRLTAAATPEVWEEHDEPVEPARRFRLPVQPRVLAAIGGGVALLLIAWVLWTQAGSGGLRPSGGLDSIEDDLRGQKTAGSVEPQTASVDRDGETAPHSEDGTPQVAAPADASAQVPVRTGAEGVHEDTAPPLPPAAAETPAVTPVPIERPAQPAAASTAPPKNAPATSTAKPKPVKKPAPPPKQEPRTSPEDAAGPPR